MQPFLVSLEHPDPRDLVHAFVRHFRYFAFAFRALLYRLAVISHAHPYESCWLQDGGEMQPTDDDLRSPYSTPSFAGSFSAPSSEPQAAPAFHRYQHGDLVAPWYAAPSPEQHAHSGHSGTPPLPQSYHVLGPYMMAGPAIYGQPLAYDSGTAPNQQIQGHFSPEMADPRTPAPSPPNQGVPAVYYQNSPAASYQAQHTVPVTVPMAYNSPGHIGHLVDYSTPREGHGVPRQTLYHNGSTTSLESMASTSYPPATGPSGAQTYTFVASEASSFTSDNGGGSQRSQKAPKKRGSGTTTRRPRKPPPDVIEEPKLQTAPEIARNKPRTGSPKRPRTEVSQPEPSAEGETTPSSARIVSPRTISKAHIGQRSRTSTDASQRQSATSHVDAQRAPQSEGARLTQTEDPDELKQQLQEALEENRTLRAFKQRQDEIEKQVAELRMDFRRHERDMKCKALEIASMYAGNAMRDDPSRAEIG